MEEGQEEKQGDQRWAAKVVLEERMVAWAVRRWMRWREMAGSQVCLGVWVRRNC